MMEQTTIAVNASTDVYDHEGLTSTQKSKAEKLLELGCVKPLQGNESSKFRFEILPIKNYNVHTLYVLWNALERHWQCTCFWNRHKKMMCSHILAAQMMLAKIQGVAL